MNRYLSLPLSGFRPRRERGFTLFEIMVVVMIVGLVVAIGFPTMRRSLVRARLLSQANVLKQAVAVARASALKRGQGVAVRFLQTDSEQKGGDVIAWVDGNSNGGLDAPAEAVIGRWAVKGRVLLKPDPGNLLFKLSGTTRGVFFLPNGTAIARAGGRPGVGQGAVVVSDYHQNEIRLLILAGTGTVIQEMRNPESGAWSKELRFWRY